MRERMRVEHEVMGALRSSAYSHRGARVFQWLCHPAFDQDIWTWDVFQTLKNGHVVVETKWHLEKDMPAYGVDGVPEGTLPLLRKVKRIIQGRPLEATVSILEAPLDGQAFERCLDALTKVPLCMNPDFSVGLDGAVFEFCVGHEYGGCRYSWWVDIPNEWKQVEAPLKELLDLLEAALKRQNSET